MRPLVERRGRQVENRAPAIVQALKRGLVTLEELE
jgi:hypothetical protein